MRNTIYYALIIILILSITWFVIKKKPAHQLAGAAVADSVLNAEVQQSGTYFPPGTGEKFKSPDGFITWKWMSYDEDDHSSVLLASVEKISCPFITIETHAYSDKQNVLEDLVNGKYDQKIKATCKRLQTLEKNLYLSLNPDMEVPVKLFPWQYQSPSLYADAFNHFARIVKKNAPSAKVVWSVAAYPGIEEFWPGPEHVDAIRVNLGGISELQATAYPRDTVASNAIRRKLIRLRMMKKPVMLTGGTHNNPYHSALHTAKQSLYANREILYKNAGISDVLRSKPERRSNLPVIGVYDPKQSLTSEKEISVEHIFIDFSVIQDHSLKKMLAPIDKRNHSIILTVEPWKGKKWKQGTDPMQKILAGEYDEEFTELYKVISEVKNKVYLRFAHEMEIPITRYPWQSRDPVSYIKAFRYFMLFPKTPVKNVLKVWGPAGDRGSVEWWPGNDVVDYVSIAIYGLPDKNITDPEKQESFSDIYKRKSHRMRFLNKPFFITEFGVKGDDAFQCKWMKDAGKTIRKNKAIAGVNYFNFEDVPEAWGNIPAPKWNISKKTFSDFINELQD